jgi:polyferredoxin
LKDAIRRNVLKFNTARRIVQFLSFILFSAIIFNLGSLPLLLPVLWTWGLPQNTVGDAFTSLQLALYQAVFPWLAIAAFLVVGIVIGKAMCGWVCPFGFIQDLIVFIKRKKMELSVRTHETMVNMKYLILGIALFVSLTFAISKLTGAGSGYEGALGIFTRAPFTALSPAETLFAILPRMVHDYVLLGTSNFSALFWAQLVIMIIVLVLVAYVPRSWCRYLCPHGAIMAVLNRFSFIGLRRDPVKCAKGGCRLCVQACPMRVPILDSPWKKFSDPECIYCMKCVDACQDKAIKLTYP